MAGLLQRICLVDADDTLPEVHQSLARNTESAREATIIEGALLEARTNSMLPVAEGNAVLVTKHMVDLFRNHRIYSDGVEFGEGLSPFSIVCQGHPNAQEARRSLEDAGRVERGAALSLADARAIAVSDARMPTMLQHLVEKLYGYSILLDTFLGMGHELATNLREQCRRLGPSLMALASYHGSPSTALRMGIRILFQVQQMVFRWLRLRRDNPAPMAIAGPDFESLVSDVGSFLLSGVPELPSSWNRFITQENNAGPPEPDTRRLRGGAGTGEQTVHNGRLDPGIRARWARTGFERTSQMTANFQADSNHASWKDATPKFSDGTSACLNWGIKGKCFSQCPRKDAHKQMGVAMITQLNTLMDRCQVARS
jgi:hypothetical protein